MDFSKWLVVGAVTWSAALTGCSNQVPDNPSGQYMIGVPASSVSMLSNPGSDQASKIVVFDKTVRRIHQFDLTTMQKVKSMDVSHSDHDHGVLYSESGNYVVDFSEVDFNIIDSQGVSHPQNLGLNGKPKSVAFNAKAGVLVICDDAMSVGILKIDANGNVLGSWTKGPMFGNSTTIYAGDVNSAGQLVLAMSDGSIAVVDVTSTLAQQKWVFAQFSTNLIDIQWVAPVNNASNLFLVRSDGRIALVDIAAQSVVATQNFTDPVEKMSKFQDPHILTRAGTQRTIHYVDTQGKLQAISMVAPTFDSPDSPISYQIEGVLDSRLDLQNDTWSVVNTKQTVDDVFDNYDSIPVQRTLMGYRFSDFKDLYTQDIADNAQIQLANQQLFSLYPSKLGYATLMDMRTKQQSEIKFFNLKDLNHH